MNTTRAILKSLPTSLPCYGENMGVPKAELEQMVAIYGLEIVVMLLSIIAEEKGWQNNAAQLEKLNLKN
jgi:hypothetical protein